MKTIKEFNAEVLSTKQGLLEQIDDCIDIMLSPIENYEKRMELKTWALEDKLRPFEDEHIHLLTEKGYQTENGGITLFYNETGKIQFAMRDLAVIYNMVKKNFPNTAVSSNKTRSYSAKGGSIKTAQELMSIRTSFEDTQIAYDNAKHNYEQAMQSGNSGLINVFTEHATIQKECMRIAKNIDYAAMDNEKKYKSSSVYLRWQNEFNKDSSKYYRLGFSPITTNQYLALQAKELINVPYDEAAVISDFLYSLKVGRCAGIDDYIKKNVTAIVNADMNIRTRFGRKDGNGFVKPKNNNEERSFRDMQNTLDRTKFISKVMNDIFHVSDQKAAV